MSENGKNNEQEKARIRESGIIIDTDNNSIQGENVPNTLLYPIGVHSYLE